MAKLPEGFPSPTLPGVIELKQYPPYRAATVRTDGQLAIATAVAFNPLFAHISRNDIAMTSPVEARYPTLAEAAHTTEGQVDVSFLYGSQDLPIGQTAGGVVVEDHPAMTVVSLGLVGEYSWERFQQGLKELKVWLANHPCYHIVGPVRRFLYDSPSVPANHKRSEVQLPIEIT
jgi:hypothetical protein